MAIHKKLYTPINFILFQVCWFACVWGAGNNSPWLGPILVALCVPLQIFLLTECYKAEIIFTITCGMIGFLLETILIVAGIYTLSANMSAFVCPPWMAALWFNFALLVSISLAWLKGKYLLAAILGGFAGPVAYWGGEKLGAIQVAYSFLQGYLPLALLWAVALPSLVYAHGRIVGRKKTDQ